MPEAKADELRETLAAHLRALSDGEFVILGEPMRYAAPSGRFRHKPRPLPGRYVQYLRMGDDVAGECVGATAFGGTWEISPADSDRLRALGWQTPADQAGRDAGAPNYSIDAARYDTPRLAQMGVDALGVLRAPLESLEFRHGS